jgi:hypothetical protein
MDPNSTPPTEPQPRHPLDELVGPFYDATGVTKWLRITPDELNALVDSGQILETQFADGDGLFPTFQFGENKELLPRLGEAARAVRLPDDDRDPDGWAVAMMLNSEVPEWDGRTAAQLLRTEWADEVMHQLTYGERAPLERRARMEEQYEIARAILAELLPLIGDLPVDLNAGTLVVGEGEKGYGAGLLVRNPGQKGSLALLSFGLAGDPGEIAAGLLAELRERFPNGARENDEKRHD